MRRIPSKLLYEQKDILAEKVALIKENKLVLHKLLKCKDLLSNELDFHASKLEEKQKELESQKEL